MHLGADPLWASAPIVVEPLTAQLRSPACVLTPTLMIMNDVLDARVGPGGPLTLPFPQILPTQRAELRGGVLALQPYWLSPAELLEDPAATAAAALGFLDRFCPASSRPPDPDAAEAENYAEHDDFFAVVRVPDNAAVALLAGTVLSHARVLIDLRTMGTTMPPEQLGVLLSGYGALHRYATGDDCDAPVPLVTIDTPVSDDETYRPTLRWRLGHQHFFVQIQELVTALNLTDTAVRDSDDDGVRSGLLLASQLAHSAAAGLRFTGDFREGDYRSVRDTMLPPRLSAGFSGMQTRDHHALVQLFHRLPLDGLRRHATEYHSFLTATREMYTAHVHVCDHFGGDVGPSLRMEARSHEQSHSAASAVVEALAQGHLQLLDPDTRSHTPAT